MRRIFSMILATALMCSMMVTGASATGNTKTFTLKSGDSMTISNYVGEKKVQRVTSEGKETITCYLVNQSTEVSFHVTNKLSGTVALGELTDAGYSFDAGYPLDSNYGWGKVNATDLLVFTIQLEEVEYNTYYPIAGFNMRNYDIGHFEGDSYVVDDALSVYLLKAEGGPNTAYTVGFTDVTADSYYADGVKWAVRKEVTVGTSATTFSPEATCSNGQILTFLWRANGQPEPTIANPFTDVKTSDYYYKAALWASEKGLIAGTKLGADAPCTRSMVVTYLWKLAGQPAATKATTFTDVDSNADYAKAVAWAVEQGITSGTSATTFAPDTTCTRGQIVTFLFRAMGKA